MRTVALVSGGKDSCYNMMQCVAAGHEIVALANLQPDCKDELDSYMYQTVGHQGIELYSEAMGLPLYREKTSGIAKSTGKVYEPTDTDEVEDLYRLLSKVKDEMSIEAVAVGAILSDYQRVRVENVCSRLGLTALAYLWRRNQTELLKEMISSGVEAVIIKVAALGLDPYVHLGMAIRDAQPHLLVMQEKYGLNVCGEGGEYETFTLDCPLFRKKLVIDEKELVIHTDDPIAPVGYLNLKLHLEPKAENALQMPASVKTSSDYVNDLSDSVFSDLSDIELNETDIESIERLESDSDRSNRKKRPTDQEDEYSEDDRPGVYGDADGERHPVPDHGMISGNEHGWYFIGGIVGEGESTASGTEDAVKKLITLCSSRDLGLPDICSVNLYIANMDEYAELNRVYVSHFNFVNPPTRVCVQCPLPENVTLIMDAVAYKMPDTPQDGDTCRQRATMHVQGISHWAPANIGPYSQAYRVGEVVGSCGQIALVPGSMRLLDSGGGGGHARRETALALRHVSRVLRAAHAHTTMRSVVQGVCYVTCRGAVSEARRQLERRTAAAIVDYVLVDALPRRAAVEWAVWAHSANNRFDYEETGCNVGDYKVAITRRWNYENTVAAFQCYVATASSPSSCRVSFPSEGACAQHKSLASQMTVDDLQEVFAYCISKLFDDCQERAQRSAVNLRVFYQVWSAPGAARMLEAAARVRSSAPGLVCTLVPVPALHNAFTLLSLAGCRIDE